MELRFRLNMNDKDFFASEMAGVEPLTREARVRAKKSTLSAAQRRDRKIVAEGADEGCVNPLIVEGVKPLDSWSLLAFKRPGIQLGVYKKLRLGKYEIDACLDLHRKSVFEASVEVFSFIEEASTIGLRTIMILHGKGQSRGQVKKTAVLKGYVNHWLREFEEVQAFHSAQPAHGGTGAVYVLLKKSSAQRLENRLKYSKGRV